MNKKAKEIAEEILNTLANKGLNFGNEEIIKIIYESLILNIKGEYYDNGRIGLFFMLVNGTKEYGYVIGRRDRENKGAGRKLDTPKFIHKTNVSFTYPEGTKTMIQYFDDIENVTIEDVMLEMQILIADQIKDMYKCKFNNINNEWEDII